MDGTARALQQKLQKRSAEAYRRMFEGANKELVTLTEREEMAVLIAKELAAFLLEEHVALDAAAKPAEASKASETLACCPKCGQAGTAAVQSEDPLPERKVITRAGKIGVRRQRWRCLKCRIFFFPLDVRLRLGTEGYSPAVLEKAARQAAKAPSFAEASEDLRELAEIEISPTHLQRLSERVGEEWVEIRDDEVERFRKNELERTYKEPPKGAAAVMLDGGRLQTRADDHGPGVFDEHWRESKVACCLTLNTKAQEEDPQPEPPAKFLEPTQAARLAAEIKRRRTVSSKRDADGKADDHAADKEPSTAKAETNRQKRKKGRKRRTPKKNRTRVRTVVATMANSATFGWQVAAEVHRRRLDEAKRKACVCDGQAYNWSVYEMHLLPLGFIAILDFVHLLAYLYDAAQAWRGADAASAWTTYEQWLRWAWSGKVGSVLSGLRAASAELKAKGSSAADRVRTLDEALTYITNNRARMNYPEYRRLGLPISSAPVESTIKQINRRVKGTEKFWLEGGAEAILQLRAAQLCQDDRWATAWKRPRKHRRAAGAGRLSQSA